VLLGGRVAVLTVTYDLQEDFVVLCFGLLSGWGVYGSMWDALARIGI
jgi:hypothetical protein